MYNSKIKNEYIEGNGLNNKDYLHRIFSVIGCVEQQKDKDIYEFSREEIISAICDSVKTNNISTLYKYYYEVMKYITWAARMGYSDMVMSARLIIDDNIKSDLAKYATSNIKNNIIRSPKDLNSLCEKFLNVATNKPELPTINDIALAYIHLVYNSVQPDEALSLRCADCCFALDGNMVINYKGSAFVIYAESKAAISKLLTYREYTHDGGKKIIEMDDYLIGLEKDISQIHGVGGRDLKKVKAYLSKYINKKISRHNKENCDESVSLSINDIYKFGIVYRLKQNEGLTDIELLDLLSKQGIGKGAMKDIINCYHAW